MKIMEEGALQNVRHSVNLRIALGAVLRDDELPKGSAHDFAGRAVSTTYVYRSIYGCMSGQRQKEHSLHMVRPQWELLLPNPSPAHRPKTDYFATNYLQMWSHLKCYENSRMDPGLGSAEDGVDNITQALLFSAGGRTSWPSVLSPFGFPPGMKSKLSLSH